MDDVFVFINTYRQATHLEDPQLRMIHTIQTAGKATFFTSLTTAAAYAANIFSQVGAGPPARPGVPCPPPPPMHTWTLVSALPTHPFSWGHAASASRYLPRP